MNEAECVRIMKETLNTSLIKYGLFFVVMFGSAIFSTIQLVRKTTGNPKKVQRILVSSIAGSVACIWLFCANLLPLCRDIQYMQIVEVHGKYYFDSKEVPHKLGLDPGHCTITVAGKSYTLDLPVGWSKTDFPFGSFEGTIYYAKECKIILEFIPDS